MSAVIKGVQVTWGIPSAVKTFSDSAVTAGIVQSYSTDTGSGVEEVTDEDGDIVAAIFHGVATEGSLEVVCQSTTDSPTIGEVLTVATLDGLSGGQLIVTGTSPSYGNAAVKKLTIKFKHYPGMSA